jgi:YebC/PmpR family DNA-binding regulatory protein
MSGHSKWSTIKRQKTKSDVKKGLTFTKLSKAIIIAVKQGGGITDPGKNFRLRLAIDAARASNMPKENIERTIQRAVRKDEGDIEEVIYEGFAPLGVALMIEAATDNPQRTTSEIKNIFNKSGANFGQPGSVSYQFSQMGRIDVLRNDKTMDEIFSMAIEAGAQDIEETDDGVAIYTGVSDLARVKNYLSDKGLNVFNAQLFRKPKISMEIGNPDELGKVKNFIETINNLEDVQNVYSNLKE